MNFLPSIALSLMKAQAAVAEYPEFKGNVAFVGTCAFWRPVDASPSSQGYHWNTNAETCRLIGEANQLTKLPGDDARITEVWRVLFQRTPTTAEIQRTKSFLASYPNNNAEKWAAQVRVLMASNEFLHVD